MAKERNWYDEGVKAGKTEGWMNLEETLAEDLEAHPSFARDPIELVQTSIDGWEETDHFQILYGSKMMADAREELGDDADSESVIEKYQDHKESFWEGYLAGRKSIGRDVYKVARDLIATKGKAKRFKGSRKPSLSKKSSPEASARGLR